MRTAEYAKIEASIARGDKAGIYQRWLYGRRLIEDSTASHPGGRLKHGVIEALIAAAENVGAKLNAREVQYRVQCAKAFSTEIEIRHAHAHFSSWYELVQAGFPTADAATPADPAARPHIPLTTRELKAQQKAAKRERMAKKYYQGDLFPFEWDADTQLREMRRYAVHELEIASRDHQQAGALVREVEYLLEAVNRNEDVTWGEAQKALNKLRGQKVS